MHESSSNDSIENELLTQYQKKRYQELVNIMTPGITEIKSEEELIAKTKVEKMIVHFYKDGFKFCNEIDGGLKKISKEYGDIKFYRIRAEICPLVCEKLNIQVLPFLAFFKNGFFVGQHVGLEKVGDSHCDLNMLKEMINKSELML